MLPREMSLSCGPHQSLLEIRSKIKTLGPSASLRELDVACVIQAKAPRQDKWHRNSQPGYRWEHEKFYNSGAKRFLKGTEALCGYEEVW